MDIVNLMQELINALIIEKWTRNPTTKKNEKKTKIQSEQT